ncbi:MAG: hypothetical protein U0704_12735 [Candidatus Eisenbacteria bacterium]
MTTTVTATAGADVRAVARFHAPLVAQAALLALAGPVLQSALARASSPHEATAAFWLAFSLATLAQSGALAVQQAGLAARRRGAPRRDVVRIAAVLGAGGSLVLALLAAASWQGGGPLRMVAAAPAVIAMAARVLLIMAPVPAFVAARGVLAGDLALAGHSAPLAWAGLLRLAVLWLALLPVAGSAARVVAGAAAAATCAVAVDLLLLARVRGRGHGREELLRPEAGTKVVATLMPVVGGLLVWTAIRPLVHAALGGLANPVDAWAAFGATLPVLMLAGAPVWCLSDVMLAAPRGVTGERPLLAYGATFAALVSVLLAAASWPPFGDPLLFGVFSVPPTLVPAVRGAMPLLAAVPLVLALRALAGAWLLRHGGADRVLTFAPLRLLVVLAAGMLAARLWPGTDGARLGVALVLLGDVADAALLLVSVARVRARRGRRAPDRSDEASPLREAA